MEKMIAKAATMKTDQLKEMATILMDDVREGAETVLVAVLDVLEVRLSEKEFAGFCEKLAA